MPEADQKSLMYGFVGFGVIIMFVTSIMGMMNSETIENEGVSIIDSDKFDAFNNTFNRLITTTNDPNDPNKDAILTDLGEVQAGVDRESEGGFFSEFGIAKDILDGIWNAVKMPLTGMDFMSKIFGSRGTQGGGIAQFGIIPAWIGWAIMGFISVLLVYGLVRLIWGRLP